MNVTVMSSMFMPLKSELNFPFFDCGSASKSSNSLNSNIFNSKIKTPNYISKWGLLSKSMVAWDFFPSFFVQFFHLNPYFITKMEQRPWFHKWWIIKLKNLSSIRMINGFLLLKNLKCNKLLSENVHLHPNENRQNVEIIQINYTQWVSKHSWNTRSNDTETIPIYRQLLSDEPLIFYSILILTLI